MASGRGETTRSGLQPAGNRQQVRGSGEGERDVPSDEAWRWVATIRWVGATADRLRVGDTFAVGLWFPEVESVCMTEITVGSGLHKFVLYGTGWGRTDVAICCPGGYGLWSGRGASPVTGGMGKRLQDGRQSDSEGIRTVLAG